MKQKPTARHRWYQKRHNERAKWRRGRYNPMSFTEIREIYIDPRSYKLKEAVLVNRFSALSNNVMGPAVDALLQYMDCPARKIRHEEAGAVINQLITEVEYRDTGTNQSRKA